MSKRHLRVATLAMLVLALTAAACSGQQAARTTKPKTTTTTRTATSAPSATRPARAFKASLVALNGSGATGMATVTVQGDTIRVHVVARGLEPGERHLVDIHGFRDGTKSKMPAIGDVSLSEADSVTGPALLPLHPTPTASKAGTISFDQTIANARAALPIDVRAIEVHGMTRNGTYDASAPVSAGLFHAMMSGSPGTGGSMGTSGSPGMGGSTGTSGSPGMGGSMGSSGGAESGSGE